MDVPPPPPGSPPGAAPRPPRPPHRQRKWWQVLLLGVGIVVGIGLIGFGICVAILSSLGCPPACV